MIQKCLTVDPEKRLNATELLAHPYFCDVAPAPSIDKSQASRNATQRARSQNPSDQPSCLQSTEVMGAIKLPRNLSKLNKGLLPEKQYSMDLKMKQIDHDNRSKERVQEIMNKSTKSKVKIRQTGNDDVVAVESVNLKSRMSPN